MQNIVISFSIVWLICFISILSSISVSDLEIWEHSNNSYNFFCHDVIENYIEVYSIVKFH